MRNCDYLVPRFFGLGVPLSGSENGKCLLKKGHEGEHLVKTSEGYYLWRPEENFCTDSEGKVCDCDYIECYIYQQISNAQAKRMLAKNGAGTD